jgi:hypothetical protein
MVVPRIVGESPSSTYHREGVVSIEEEGLGRLEDPFRNSVTAHCKILFPCLALEGFAALD